MPGIFTSRLVVPAEAIDANGHTNNIAYVQWMQDVAIEHSTAMGWSIARYLEAGTAWVARSHYVEYLRPSFLGEELAVHTWVTAMDERSCPRRYLFVHARDRRIVAKAETRWVFVDLKSGRPTAIPEAMRASFPVNADDADVALELGLEAGRIGVPRTTG